MSPLSRLFGYASRDEAAGARLDDRNPWIVPPTRDAAAVLRALPTLFPAGGFVYFEGTTESIFAAWLQTHAVPAPLRIAYGTIWPKPDFFHVPLDAALLEEAAALVDRHAIPLPVVHMHVQDGTKVVFEWHDAFVDDPMHVHSDVPRERVEAFARLVHVGPVTRARTAT